MLLLINQNKKKKVKPIRSEYIGDLIRKDQKRKAKEHLETLLEEGLDSGLVTPMSDRDWTEIRQAVRDKLERQEHG